MLECSRVHRCCARFSRGYSRHHRLQQIEYFHTEGARKGYVERNLPGWLACDLDACDDLDVWFDADVKTICKYLVDDSAGNDIV